MADGRSFHGSTAPEGRSGRLITTLVAVLLVTFLAVAIAKPWGGPVEPIPSARLPEAAVTPPVPSIQTTGPIVPSGSLPAAAGPLPVAFSVALASAPATWTGLTWRQLAREDPLNLVGSVVPWRRGFVAVGQISAPPSTPVWTSADGTHWDVLPFNTATTFWPGSAVLGVAEMPTGLVALTETVQYCDGPCALTYILPVVSWTSPDGRAWTPHVLPPEWLASPAGLPPLLAAGPARLLVATTGPRARLATSTDGSQWRLLPAATFPARFALNDLRATARGYVAVGRWTTAGNEARAAASLWSSDGLHWPQAPTFLPTTPDAGPSVGPAGVLLVANDGMVAVGRGVATPGASLWWWSADGRRWAALPAFPPLGPAPCAGNGCGQQPNGALVGDGSRLLAIRGGPDGGAWVSADGRSWTPLSMSGEIPAAGATQAVLLPGGALLSDGTTTWFGLAQGT